jgi:hypothetical protein
LTLLTPVPPAAAAPLLGGFLLVEPALKPSDVFIVVARLPGSSKKPDFAFVYRIHRTKSFESVDRPLNSICSFSSIE